jgi:hypothetical protein
MEFSGFFLPEEVNDFVSGHPEQPRAGMFNWDHRAISLHQFVEDILQDVLRVPCVGDSFPDEIPKPALLSCKCFRDPLVLVGHPAYAQ